MELIIPKLAIAVTFHYSEARLLYLKTIAQEFSELAHEVNVYIITNDSSTENKQAIEECLRNYTCKYEIIVPTYIGHPFLLTWGHLGLFRKLLITDTTVTHFLYLEDDILVNKANIQYWLLGRKTLLPYGLVPSFVRYEEKESIPYCTDITKKINPQTAASVATTNYYSYISSPAPYQGMYLLDRELMEEFINSPQSNPEIGKWGIREKAAQGITFVNIPNGFSSRNVIGCITNRGIADPNCFIHHTPNNYATDPNTPFGKLPSSQLFSNTCFENKKFPSIRYNIKHLNYKKDFLASLKIVVRQLFE